MRCNYKAATETHQGPTSLAGLEPGRPGSRAQAAEA